MSLSFHELFCACVLMSVCTLKRPCLACLFVCLNFCVHTILLSECTHICVCYCLYVLFCAKKQKKKSAIKN